MLEQEEVVLALPVEVTVLQVVTGVTAGVVHDELGPHETLITLLTLEQEVVGEALAVAQDVRTATPPAKL